MKSRWAFAGFFVVAVALGSPTASADLFLTWCDGPIPLVQCNVQGAKDHAPDYAGLPEAAFRQVVPEGHWCYIPYEGYNTCW